ncbi:MAG: hypothetical protein NZL93_03085, partial [Chthoniobacterales bacterium]|nr:hypothetical protein [Chthoniobacterales bacterium]
AEAAEQAAAANPLAVVICSTDETYPQIVPAFVPELRKRLPEVRIILAGYPPDQVEAHKAAGVQDFIHIRLSCLEFNRQLHATLGISS